MRFGVLVLAMAVSTGLSAQSPSTFKLTHTYVLGGDGGWDYIVPDPPNHRLFIARPYAHSLIGVFGADGHQVPVNI